MKDEMPAGHRAGMAITSDFRESYFHDEVGSDWKEGHGSDGKGQNHKTAKWPCWSGTVTAGG